MGWGLETASSSMGVGGVRKGLAMLKSDGLREGLDLMVHELGFHRERRRRQ